LALLAAQNEQLALGLRRRRGTLRAARHGQGKLLVRERLGACSVDRDASFLELSPLAAWGRPFHVGASIVTGIGFVSGVELFAHWHDPTCAVHHEPLPL